jgi:negative regulator of sigma E activity
MQRYTIFFITVNAVHVSGGFSAHLQELKNCTRSIGYMLSLLAATSAGSSKQAWHIPDAECTVLELLMMDGDTARNMYSIDSNKEYCITLHLVGCT